MHNPVEPSPWLLALESSTPHGGAALLRDGVPVDAIRLEEGLRHGRELVSSAAVLLRKQNLSARDLRGVAVSAGPGSYTGVRVGVMAAKALAYGGGCALTAVSSLAALGQSRFLADAASENDAVLVMQDARRDEVYMGAYFLRAGEARADLPDIAVTPEEAAGKCRAFWEQHKGHLALCGSGFATYRDVCEAAFAGTPLAALLDTAVGGRVEPEAVGVLGWRQILREETAGPMALQPVYLRRDEGADWRHDHLIQA